MMLINAYSQLWFPHKTRCASLAPLDIDSMHKNLNAVISSQINILKWEVVQILWHSKCTHAMIASQKQRKRSNLTRFSRFKIYLPSFYKTRSFSSCAIFSFLFRLIWISVQIEEKKQTILWSIGYFLDAENM